MTWVIYDLNKDGKGGRVSVMPNRTLGLSPHEQKMKEIKCVRQK